MKEILVIGATWCAGCKVLKAIDKSKKSKLLTDLYRMKGLVQSKGESVSEV